MLQDLFPTCDGRENDIIMEILDNHDLLETDSDGVIYVMVCLSCSRTSIIMYAVIELTYFIPVASPSTFGHALTHSGGF